MKITFILFLLLIATGLLSLTDQEILLDFAQESEGLKEYELVVKEKNQIFYLHGENNEDEIEFLFISSTQDEVRGYSGANKVIITVDEEKSIKKAVIVKSYDTRSFVRRVQKSKFLSQFKAWNGEEAITAVTGATITSNSVKTTILNLLTRIETIEISKN